MKQIKRIILFSTVILVFIAIFTSACAKDDESVITNSESVLPAKTQTPAFDRVKEKLGKTYLMTNVDMEQQQMMLRDIENGRQLLYTFDENTLYKDKYGGNIRLYDFPAGRACVINGLESSGLITELCQTDKVWEIDEVENFSIDSERGIFTIGVTNYSLPPNVPVFSNDTQTDISTIIDSDVLRVTGQDKEILSITITTGHGIIHIINTDVFNGSLICIGNIYKMVEGEAEIDVPEGTYNVTVANKGYGGTTEVTVGRNEILVLNLDELKGELQYCKLKFTIEAEGAKIYLDGKKVKKNKNNKVEYGKHTLSVEADGYENWTKDLYVNSPTATIKLTMDEEGSSNKTNNTNSNNTSNNSNSNINNNNTNNTNNNTSNNTNNSTNNNDDNNSSSEKTEEEKKQETELEYLTTIRDTVASIMSGLTN